MKKYTIIFIQFACFIFPWFIRRKLLNLLLNIKIHKTAHVGYSIILARSGYMHKSSKIMNFTFVNELDNFIMNEHSKIGKNNWITGSSSELKKGYAASPNRKCEFILGIHSRITTEHHFDCNGGVYIDDFTTIAGKGSQILTHGIDIVENIQKADSVKIGKYCFVGTKSLFLMGSSLPSYSLLAAGSVVSKSNTEPYSVYAGVPAKKVKTLPKESKYFHRTHGNVN
jgi:acetyltransferase-like isoleucine patch superfamily enzyme